MYFPYTYHLDFIYNYYYVKKSCSSPNHSHSFPHSLFIGSFFEIPEQLPHILIIGKPFNRISLMILIVFEVEDLIDGQLEHIIDHPRDEHFED